MSGGRLRASMVAWSLALVAGAIAGCGSGTQTVTATITRATTQTVTVTQTVTHTTTVRAPAHTTPSGGAPVTATSTTPSPSTGSGSPMNSLTVRDTNGSALLVTVNGVLPATPASTGFAPPTGNRLVALSLTLSDTGPGTITSDADVDATLTGTDGRTYTASYDPVSQCTNFSDGSFTLADGASQTGCVVFQIPTAVSDSSVQFSLGSSSVRFEKS